MPSLNKVILMGNMTADPELKKTPADVSVTSFSIGVQRRFKDASGNYLSDFISIVAWRQTAEFICKFFRKGMPICIVGSIQTRSYEKDGQKRYLTEVVAEEATFTERSQNGTQTAPAPAEAPRQAVPAATHPEPILPPTPPAQGNFQEISGDDDLPF